MFLKRKRCGKVKARGCADGRSQREYINKEESSSPTVSVTAIILSSLIDAIEERCVGIYDIPGAFLQCKQPPNEVVHIKLVGAMADLYISLDPAAYECFATKNRRGETVLYARMIKAMYGTLKAALLFWTKLKKFLTKNGFEPNAYDPCTVNKIINGKQATVMWYVDDVKISHKDESTVKMIVDVK